MIGQTILRTLTAAGQNGWASIAIKATVAMLAAMLIVRLTRRASAALRHLVVAATLGALLLLPLAAMLVPARTVTLPATTRAASPQVAVSQPTAAARIGTTRPIHTSINVMAIAYLTYAGGVALLVSSLLLGVLRVHRIRGRANVSVAGTRTANEIARQSGMRGGIEVAVADDLAVPITFGWRHAVILLPGATSGWSDGDLQCAIRHEIEHIARGDWAAQIVSRLACAMYWPHPFVWVLWRRLRLEAERACDDAVIRSCSAAEPYAEQLVALARRLIGRDVPALAMATRTDLGKRIEAILDHNRRRAPLARFTSFVIAVIAATFTITVAPFKLMSATIAQGSDRGSNRSVRHQSADDADPLDMALLMAAERDDRSTMRRLLERGAAANAAIDGDGSPLIAAARKGHVEAMQMLIAAGADVNRGVEGDGNPLTEAARGGYLEAVRLLLDRGAHIDEGVEGDGNALIAAAGAGRFEVVTFLLDNGASIEKVVRGDENALIHACESGQPAVVRLLIARGANVNARVWADFGDGERGHGEWRSPLIMATRNHHEDVVNILRAAGGKE